MARPPRLFAPYHSAITPCEFSSLKEVAPSAAHFSGSYTDRHFEVVCQWNPPAQAWRLELDSSAQDRRLPRLLLFSTTVHYFVRISFRSLTKQLDFDVSLGQTKDCSCRPTKLK